MKLENINEWNVEGYHGRKTKIYENPSVETIISLIKAIAKREIERPPENFILGGILDLDENALCLWDRMICDHDAVMRELPMRRPLCFYICGNGRSEMSRWTGVASTFENPRDCQKILANNSILKQVEEELSKPEK